MSKNGLGHKRPQGLEIDERGFWADGGVINWRDYTQAQAIWLDDILNDLVCHQNVRPEDIHIDKTKIGGFVLPLVRVRGVMRYMFDPYLESSTSSDKMTITR